MKNKYLFSLCLFTILFVNLKAQIDSVKVLTPNPTTLDTIKFVGYTSFTSNGCNKTGHLITTPTSNEVYVDACHDDSLFMTTCTSVDTFKIAPLTTAGNYKIGYIVRRVNFASDPATCGGSPIADSVNIHLTVTFVAGIANNNVLNNNFSLFPNPAADILSIKYEMENNVEGASITIYNVVGQEVHRVALKNPKGVIEINISQFNSGIYYGRIETPANKYPAQRFQKIN